MLSDNRLMLRVKDGELDQLGLLFERYHRLLFSFFYNRSKNAALSEDLVQNVFVRVLKYRRNFRGDGEFKAWLFHIARNVQYDYHRKWSKRHTEDVDEWKDRIEDDRISQHDRLVETEKMEQLRIALQHLEPDKREVIVLAKLKGMKYAEIGQLLGCTEGAVKVRVYRALKELKHIYQNTVK
jgi:RNA polymerase sigma-70 factor (ECF subfamily)